MKKVISALICAAMLAAMIAVGIPAAAGATFFKTAELLELKEHIEDDAAADGEGHGKPGLFQQVP